MTEPTPPAERPLPDQARARIRADLVEHAQQHRAPRWLVPLGSAAAVALVAGLGYWAVHLGGDEGATPPVATQESTSAPASLDPSAPVTGAPVQVSTATTLVADCETQVADVSKGAALALQVDETSSFWVKGDSFVLCDQLEGRTTVHRALPLTPRDDVATYAVSTDVLDGQTVRSAGGVVPPGLEDVFDVAYTFPDGHTEHATKATDDQGRTWWRMTYTYGDGGGNELDQPQIEVTVSLSGVQKAYTLQWGPPDTCAQVNHGC